MAGSVAHNGSGRKPDLDRIVSVSLSVVDLEDIDRSQCQRSVFESEAHDDDMPDRTDRHTADAWALFDSSPEPVAVPEHVLARVGTVHMMGPRNMDSGRICCQKDNLDRRSHSPAWELYAQADVVVLEEVDLAGAISGIVLVVCSDLVGCTDV